MQKSQSSNRSERLKVIRQNASVQSVSSGKPIDCLLLDVSEKGVGLTTLQNILPDTQVVMKLGDKSFQLTLVWCQVLERQRSGFRYGFRCQDPRLNMVDLFMAHGLISPSVLLVEDDADVVELYLTYLEGNGFRVDVANSGGSAVSAMDKKQFDVIVTDMIMPNGGGLSVVNEARQQKIPVAVVTGFAEACAGVIPSDVPVLEKLQMNERALPNLVSSLLRQASKAA